MRIRPFFWLLLAVCCICVLTFAATIQEHIPALLSIQLTQQQPKANSITAVQLHLTDEQGLPLDAAQIDSLAEMTNMPMSTKQSSVRYLGQGNYLAQFRLYMAGPWAITFQAHATGFDPLQQTLLLQVQ
jgi:YtkA-like